MTGLKKYRTVLLMCAAIGWWGIWFPELAVWTGAVCAEDGQQQKNTVQQKEKVIECDSVREIYEGLLQADREQIQMKSRLLTMIDQYLQKK